MIMLMIMYLLTKIIIPIHLTVYCPLRKFPHPQMVKILSLFLRLKAA